MIFHIITIFPEIFSARGGSASGGNSCGYFNNGILARAQKNKIIQIKTYDLRKWTTDKHKTVDDTPYGGGAGMVMKIEPLYKAIQFIKKSLKNKKYKIILFSAKGKTWNQAMAKKHSKLNNLILICGRYEGVDERIKKFIDEEISIGEYVLTGGEIPAMAIVDSIARLLPGALGNAKSIEQESHSIPGLLEYPQYTRPEIFITSSPCLKERNEVRSKKLRVPKILLSGNHKKIEDWRKKHQKQI